MAKATVLVAMSISAVCAADAVGDDTVNPVTSGDNLTHINLNEINARVTYPSNWHVAFSQGKLMQSLVITAPKHSERSETSARFTINPVSNLMRVRFRRVSEQVDAFARALSTSPSVRILRDERIRKGDYVGRDLVLQSERGSDGVRQERRLYLAHDARDWLVIVSFVADVSQWQDLTPIRTTMFDELLLH